MRALLRAFPEGVPQETLLARIRGRRAYLVSDWDRLLLAPEPLNLLASAPWRPEPAMGSGRIWQALQGEYYWVFRWLPEPLRLATAPFFWLAELRTLAICLRRLAGGATSEHELLQKSLMHQRITGLLRTPRDAGTARRLLAGILAPHAPACARLAEVQPGELEAELADIFLQQLAATPLHPLMARFVALAIDCRNLVAVAKRLRWRPPTPPRLLEGGSIPLKKLAELSGKGETAALVRIAARLGGRGQSGDPASLERTVLQAEYRALAAMAREGEGIGEIIFYLWRCRNEARAIGLLSRLAAAGADAFETEIVQ